MKVYCIIHWIHHRELSHFLCTHSLLLLNIISPLTEKAEKTVFSFSRNQLSSLLDIGVKIVWITDQRKSQVCKSSECFAEGPEKWFRSSARSVVPLVHKHPVEGGHCGATHGHWSSLPISSWGGGLPLSRGSTLRWLFTPTTLPPKSKLQHGGRLQKFMIDEPWR